MSREELLGVAAPQTDILILWMIIGLWLGARQSRERASLGSNVLNAAKSAVLAGTLTIVVTFFSWRMGVEMSRSFVVLLLPVSFTIMIVFRYAALFLLAFIPDKWAGQERVAVIGATADTGLIIDSFRRQNPCVNLAGVILPEAAGSGSHLSSSFGPVLGTTACLGEVINTAQLTRLVLTTDRFTDGELSRCYRVAARMGVTVSWPITHATPNLHIDITECGGQRLLNTRPIAFTRRQEILKRCFDIAFSAVLLIVLCPLLLILALLVRVTSRGPALYKCVRVGKGGRHFTFLKFRSMYSEINRQQVKRLNEKDGHLFKVRNDPRITPLGKILRRWSLDELPQLINVLRGDMSIVGPRPLPACDLDPDGQSQDFAWWAEQRSRVLPGITGLWQIRGRSELPFSQMVELDLEYIQTWSVNLDFRILFETPMVLITGRGAY